VNWVIEQTKSKYAEEASKPVVLPQPTLAGDTQQDSLRRTVSR
jgi:hypothetical protein